jgi:hypothetical protein
MLEGLMKRPEVFQAKFHTKSSYRPPKEYFKGASAYGRSFEQLS